MTKRIQDLTSQMLLIEYDHKMISHLQHHHVLTDHTQIVHKDILEREATSQSDFPFQTPPSQTLIVGNLPYYITSPILRRFFETQQSTWAGGVFLIQKEPADKIVHDAPKKSFLWWLLNYAYRVEHCFDVPPTAFTPAPKVVSSVIRILPKDHSQIPLLNYQHLIRFLDLYSPYKRKTLGASSKIVAKQQKSSDQVPFVVDTTEFASRRLEELGREEMIALLTTVSGQ